MAPKVQVPADFGKHHIGAPSHGNLIFKLKDGKEVRANSMILSLNSPVIDNLTTNLDQQSLDVDDFHRDAVDCFIEAAYTGELENIKRSNFRDVNKMSHVFDVSWLSLRCARYFKSLVEELDMNEYEEILFVVDEARFVRNALKKRDFLELVVSKMSYMATERNIFIDRYMIDYIKFPKDQLDVAIEIVGVDVHVMVRILVFYIEEHKENLDSNTSYVLENINLPLCIKNNKNEFDSLFNALDGINNMSQQDCKMFMKLSKLYAETSVISCAPVSSRKISNLFYSFKQFIDLNFEDLVEKLAVSEEVTTLYMFFDAIRVWIFHHMLWNRFNKPEFTNDMLEKIITIKENRGWRSMSYQYFINNISNSDTREFVDFIKQSGELVARKENCYILSEQEYSMQELSEATFRTTTQLKFRFSRRQHENCTEKGDCGIILQINPERRNKSSLFDIRLCTDPSEYPLDLHFHHDMINASRIHIVLGVKDHGQHGFRFMPLTWLGRPHCDETGKHWRWGYRHFYCGIIGVWPDVDKLLWKNFAKENVLNKFRYTIFLDNVNREE